MVWRSTSIPLGISIVLGALGASIPTSTLAVTLSGKITGAYEVYEGTVDPFDITLNGVTYNTGEVTFVLDKDKASNFTFDFDTMTHTYTVGLLLDSPLLKSLEAPAQKFTVNLKGPIKSVEPSNLSPDSVVDLKIFSDTLLGNGFFDPNQLLSSWTYENIQINITNNNQTTIVQGNDNTVSPRCSAESEAKGEGKVDAKLIDPKGNPTPIKGKGKTKSGSQRSSGSQKRLNQFSVNNTSSCVLDVVGTPEPREILGSSLLLGLLPFLKKRKHLAKNCAN
ncbi:MAG TPA: hypothetical protein VK203_24590 [Nostocaceae cyanobacterium]|nr:hypothetical protein [Nostocaceae cyanobacterium]